MLYKTECEAFSCTLGASARRTSEFVCALDSNWRASERSLRFFCLLFGVRFRGDKRFFMPKTHRPERGGEWDASRGIYLSMCVLTCSSDRRRTRETRLRSAKLWLGLALLPLPPMLLLPFFTFSSHFNEFVLKWIDHLSETSFRFVFLSFISRLYRLFLPPMGSAQRLSSIDMNVNCPIRSRRFGPTKKPRSGRRSCRCIGALDSFLRFHHASGCLCPAFSSLFCFHFPRSCNFIINKY